MKSLLFIGHEFHKKTKSSDFLQRLLAEKYQVATFTFDPYKDSFEVFEELKGREFDILILWQIMPSLNELKKFIKFKQVAFFPMYDNTKSLNSPLWNEYTQCNIVNFSKTFHETCIAGGLSSFYIQYFPEPAKITDEGGENDVFFWQRTSKITTRTLEKVIEPQRINKLYLHVKTDPNNKFVKPSKLWNGKVIESSWFDTKDEMKTYIQKSAIYFAPRKYEGIGMSFLEAMAAGRCVIAPDFPTMNEYIKNGENGYLYKLKRPQKIKSLNVREIQKNAAEFINNGYKKWEKEKYKIFDYIEAEPVINQALLDKTLYLSREKVMLFGFIPAKVIRKKKETIYKIFHIFPVKLDERPKSKV